MVGLFLGFQIHRETKEILTEARVTAEWQARTMAILYFKRSLDVILNGA